MGSAAAAEAGATRLLRVACGAHCTYGGGLQERNWEVLHCCALPSSGLCIQLRALPCTLHTALRAIYTPLCVNANAAPARHSGSVGKPSKHGEAKAKPPPAALWLNSSFPVLEAPVPGTRTALGAAAA